MAFVNRGGIGTKGPSRPKVIVNCAMTVDGKIAMPDGARLTISSEEDFARVHRLRNSCDAILVGINTIIHDDPSLLVKDTFIKNPRHPLRIVLDSNGRIPVKATVLDNRSKTLIAVTKTKESKVHRKLGNKKNIEVKAFGKGKVDLKGLLTHLVSRGVRSLMVEGGGETIWSFLQGGFVDEMTIFVGNMVVGGRGPTPASGDGAHNAAQTVTMELVSVQRMPGGVLLRYRPKNTR